MLVNQALLRRIKSKDARGLGRNSLVLYTVNRNFCFYHLLDRAVIYICVCVCAYMYIFLYTHTCDLGKLMLIWQG